MISPAKLDKLPTEVVSLVQELQEEIISDICRRVSKANYLTPTAEWELYKANQLNLSYKEVNRRIAKQLKVRERKVQELYTDTVKQALKEGYREGIYSDYAKDVIRPSAQECAQNGRARSTKMRWAVKAE